MSPIRLDLGFATGLIITLLCSSLSGCSQFATSKPVASPEIPKLAVEVPTKPFPADTFYDLLVAEVALHEESYDIALDNYLAQSKNTQDPGVAARAVQIAEYLNRQDAAMEAAEIWVASDPDNNEPAVVLGTLLAKAKRPNEAFDVMAKLQRQGGKPNFAAVAASASTISSAEQAKLLARFDALIAEFPDRTEPLTGKALLLQQMNQPEAALDQINEVFASTDDDLHAVVIEAQLKKQLDKENPFARLATAVETHPNNRNLRLQYARFLADDQQYDAARVQFQTLLVDTPYDTDLMFNLAQVNYASGSTEQAIKLLEFLIAIDKHTLEANYLLGEMARERGDLNAATGYYAVLPPSPELLKAAEQIANAYFEKDNAEAAHQFYETLREKYPQQALTFIIAEADVLMKAQRYNQGMTLLNDALKKYPDQANLLYTRSIFYEKMGNLVLMEADLRLLLAQDPNNIAALNALGYSLANLTTRYDEAHALVARALALRPDDAAILDSMGWVEYRRGNLTEALTYLEKAYKTFPDPEVAAHLGEILWQLDRKSDAQKIWNTSQKEHPDDVTLRNTLQRLTGKPTAE
jgi:tetratricopeptide (TPR) repeat protein